MQTIRKMRTTEANELIDKIIKKLNKKNAAATDIVEDLKKLREFALEEQDPRVTKAIRLVYEYIQENECFDISVQKEENDEGEEYYLEPGTDIENLEYALTLFRLSDNKYNREELAELRDKLKEELY